MSQNPELIQALSALTGGTQDTNVLQQVTAYFQNLSKSKEFVTMLCSVIFESERQELRHIAALLLRRKMTGLWKHVSSQEQMQIKPMMLSHIMKDALPIRRELARCIGCITKAEEGCTGAWIELVPFIIDAAQSNDASVSQTALLILSELAPEVIEQDLTRLFPLLQAGLAHQDLGISTTYLTALSESHQLTDPAFAELLPHALNVTEACFKSDDDNYVGVASGCMELLIAVVPLREYTRGLYEAMVAILLRTITDTTLAEETMRVALELIGEMAEERPKVFIGQVLDGTVVALFTCAANNEPVEEADGSVENIGVNMVFEEAVQALGRVSQGAPSKFFLPKVIEGVNGALRQSSTHLRATSLHILGVISEGCAGLMVDNLEPILDMIIPCASDPDHTVRAAAMGALRNFGEELQPRVRQQYSRILPVVFKALEDTDDVVKGHACFAMQIMCQEFEEGQFETYIPDLVPRLFQLLQSGDIKLQGPAITAIASAAQGSGEAFLPYSDGILQALVPFLNITSDDEALNMRGVATECIGAIYSTYKGLNDPSKYEQLPQVIQAVVEGFKIDHTTLRESAFTFFTVVSKFMSEQFAPYIPTILDLCVKSIGQDDHEIVEHEEDEFAGLSDDEANNPGMSYMFSSDVVEEKVSAIGAIGELSLACPKAFEPFMQKVIELLVSADVIKHPFVQVRCKALQTMGQLVLSMHSLYPNVKKVGMAGQETLHSSLGDLISEVNFHVFKSMALNSKQVVAMACSVLGTMLKTIGTPVFLTEADPMQTFQHVGSILLKLLKGKAKCQDSEYDEDEEAAEEEHDDNVDHDRILMDDVTELLSSVCEAIGPEFGKEFGTFLTPLLRYTRPSRSDDDKAMAIGAIASCVQGLGVGAADHADKLYPAAVRGIQEESLMVARNSAFALGMMCQNCGQGTLKHLPKLLPVLAQTLSMDVSNEYEGPAFMDNIVSAIARLMMAHSASLPMSDMVGPWIAQLPVKEDFEEAKPILQCLSGLMRQAPDLLAPQLAHLVRASLMMITEDEISIECRQDLAGGLKALVAATNNGQGTVQAVLEQMEPKYHEAAKTIFS
eukprot:TRINITY_DN10889_c0_g1_i2.p1 TRINITY_DN10889_c0_g1~~TRINITY_DN10889_c0_g1_i2.p1  ORF type:complete len:1075 (+),score=308.77 TRINITY_DN10889_c0_g1_i2:312-3536(+)